MYTSYAIHNLKEPRDVTELRSVLGPCSAFRRLIPKLARIADPLPIKLHKTHAQTFDDATEEKITAMKTL